jgi:hypothetical protein
LTDLKICPEKNGELLLHDALCALLLCPLDLLQLQVAESDRYLEKSRFSLLKIKTE